MPAKTERKRQSDPRAFRKYRHPCAKELAQRLDALDYGPPRQDNPDYYPPSHARHDPAIPKTVPNGAHRAGTVLLDQYIKASQEGQDWLAPHIQAFLKDPLGQLDRWEAQ